VSEWLEDLNDGFGLVWFGLVFAYPFLSFPLLALHCSYFAID
jgi:hypothetical protein